MGSGGPGTDQTWPRVRTLESSLLRRLLQMFHSFPGNLWRGGGLRGSGNVSGRAGCPGASGTPWEVSWQIARVERLGPGLGHRPVLSLGLVTCQLGRIRCDNAAQLDAINKWKVLFLPERPGLEEGTGEMPQTDGT